MAMDPVNKKALKKDFKDRADKDIDNDGDTDKTDEYLHKRRQAVSKAIGKMKESVAVFESHFKVGDKVEYEAPDGGEYYGTIIKTDKPEEGAYYHVKLENGKVVKAKPEQLESEEDEDEDDEDEDEEDLDEAKLSTSQRDRLDDLILNVHMTTHPEYDGDEGPTKYLNIIRKEFGDKVAKQVDDGVEKMHWGRDNRSSGYDKLAWRKGGARITKSGKMNAQDVKALKNRIKRDKAWGGITKAVKLPEEVEAINEVLDTPEKMDRYKAKAKYSRDRAASSAVAINLRSKNAGQREHPAKDLKTMAKRTAGLRMADKAATRKTFKALRKEEVELDEVLKVSDGMGAWIDDFKKSDAPQFKGKDEKERREMAIAAYLSAKRGEKK